MQQNRSVVLSKKKKKKYFSTVRWKEGGRKELGDGEETATELFRVQKVNASTRGSRSAGRGRGPPSRCRGERSTIIEGVEQFAHIKKKENDFRERRKRVAVFKIEVHHPRPLLILGVLEKKEKDYTSLYIS